MNLKHCNQQAVCDGLRSLWLFVAEMPVSQAQNLFDSRTKICRQLDAGRLTEIQTNRLSYQVLLGTKCFQRECFMRYNIMLQLLRTLIVFTFKP